MTFKLLPKSVIKALALSLNGARHHPSIWCPQAAAMVSWCDVNHGDFFLLTHAISCLRFPVRAEASDCIRELETRQQT